MGASHASTRVRRTLCLLGVAFASIVLVVGCGGSSEAEPATSAPVGSESSATEPSGEPIVIGAAIGETGFLAPWDAAAAQGAQLAVDEINAQGGINGQPLELIIRDTKSDLNEGVTAAAELLDQGASFIITSCDFDYGAGAASTAINEGVLAFSTCAASTKFGPEGIGKLAFTMANSAPNFAAGISEWAYEEKGIKTIYTLLDPTLDVEKQYCSAYKQWWTDNAGSEAVVGEDTFQQEDPSIAAQITRIKALPTPPDAIALCSYMPGAAKAMRQLRGAGLDMPILLGDDGDGTFWHESVPNLSDVYFATYGSIFGDDEREAVNEFFDELRAAGAPVDTSHGITGYVAIQLFAWALDQVGTLDGDALATELETLTDHPTIIGPTSFTPEAHIQHNREVAIMEIQGGEDSFVTVKAPAQTPSVD